jgi:hypothetical protein
MTQTELLEKLEILKADAERIGAADIAASCEQLIKELICLTQK